MADGFKEALESKSRRIRRWATRRHIEQDGYQCGNWHGENNPGLLQELPLDRYLGGPGSVPVDELSGGTDRNEEYFASYEGEVWNHVHGQLGWVDEEIMRFGQANLAALRDLINDVKPLPVYLRGAEYWRDNAGLTDFEHFDGAEGELGQGMPGDILLVSAMQELAYWTGATAEAYTETFGANGEEWDQIAYNNYALAEYLLIAAEAQMAVFLTARESVINVCDKTIEALWGVNDSDTGANTILSIVGAVVGLGLSLVSGGAAVPALVAAGFAITNAMVSQAMSDSADISTGETGKEFTISGDYAMDVLDSMKENLDKIPEAGVEQETQIHDALEAATGTVAASRSAFEVTFAEGVPADDMGQREVSMTTGNLEHAATTLFPRSSLRLARSQRLLDSVAGSDSAFTSEFNGAPTAVAGKWESLRSLLQELTTVNGDKISYAGGFLFDYAVEMELLDESNAEDVKRPGDLLKDLPA